MKHTVIKETIRRLGFTALFLIMLTSLMSMHASATQTVTILSPANNSTYTYDDLQPVGAITFHYTVSSFDTSIDWVEYYIDSETHTTTSSTDYSFTRYVDSFDEGTHTFTVEHWRRYRTYNFFTHTWQYVTTLISSQQVTFQVIYNTHKIHLTSPATEGTYGPSSSYIFDFGAGFMTFTGTVGTISDHITIYDKTNHIIKILNAGTDYNPGETFSTKISLSDFPMNNDPSDAYQELYFYNYYTNGYQLATIKFYMTYHSLTFTMDINSFSADPSIPTGTYYYTLQIQTELGSFTKYSSEYQTSISRQTLNTPWEPVTNTQYDKDVTYTLTLYYGDLNQGQQKYTIQFKINGYNFLTSPYSFNGNPLGSENNNYLEIIYSSTGIYSVNLSIQVSQFSFQ